MRRKIHLLIGAIFSLAGCMADTAKPKLSLPSGMKLVVETEAASKPLSTAQGKQPSPERISIPHQKYRLANGLTLILAPDNSDPLVHVDVTYHVGSAREEVGKSGFAHFFEHMMFQGSKHVGDQMHLRMITEAGGDVNGSTTRDRTNYYQTVPANQLEKVLWLESDRMGYLLDAVSQKKFEIQRSTVKNERAQRYDNRPYGLMYEKIDEALYPEDHPYAWQTIGYVEDLDRVNVNDLKAFFLRWYGPNNAVLTIGGSFDQQQVLNWVDKYFAAIPSGPRVLPPAKQPVTLGQDRFVTLEDRITQPMVVLAWSTVYMGGKTEASLDMLASILGHGKNSILYQKLVKTKKAVDVGVSHRCDEIACTFYAYAVARAADRQGLKKLYKQLDQIIQDFDQKSVQPAQLAAIKGKAKSQALFSLDSVSGKVSQLAFNQTIYGQADRLQLQLDALDKVSPQSVVQAHQKYIAKQHKVILSVVPRGQLKQAVRQANFVKKPRQIPKSKPLKESELAYRQPQEELDRTIAPPANGEIEMMDQHIYQLALDNGIPVLGAESKESPVVLVMVNLPAGERYVESGKEGIAHLTAELLQEGTLRQTSEQLQQKLDTLGSRISVNVGRYSTQIVLSSVKENMAESLSLLQEILIEPKFDKEDFKRIKQNYLEGMQTEHQQPSWLANQATRQVLYAGSILSAAPSGSQKSVAALTIKDIRHFYKKHYSPNGTYVIVVGDIAAKEVKEKLQFFRNWHGSRLALIAPQYVEPLKERKIYLVDLPNAPQSYVRLVRMGLPYDATGEMYLAQLANFNLAGNFNSRLNQYLREEKGYTYGVHSGIYGSRELGVMLFDAQVRADVTLPAIQGFIDQMKQYSQQGMSEPELQFMRRSISQKEALAHETLDQKAELLAHMITYALESNFIDQQNEVLMNTSRQELKAVGEKWLQPEDYQIIVVGDAKLLKPKLEELKLPLVQLEVEP